MVAFEKRQDGIEVRFRSDRELIPHVVQSLTKAIHSRACLETRTFLKLPVVLRELLRNAVEHGNGSCLDKLVRARLCIVAPGIVEVEVCDEGDGFDTSLLQGDRLPEDPRHLQQRGLILVEALADRLEFNEEGNRVVARIGDGGYYSYEGTNECTNTTKEVPL